MSNKSLGNPFDADTRLTHTAGCSCDVCTAEAASPGGLGDRERQILMEREAESHAGHTQASSESKGPHFDSSEDMMDRVVESAIVRGVCRIFATVRPVERDTHCVTNRLRRAFGHRLETKHLADLARLINGTLSTARTRRRAQ